MPFILKEPTTSKPTPIMMAYNFDGRRLRFSVGESIAPGNWNANTCRPRRSYEFYNHLNTLLDRIENRVKEVHLNLRSDFIQVTPDVLKQAILRDMGMEGQKETLTTYWPKYVEAKKKTNPKMDERGYKAAKAILDGFNRGKDFADINHQWFDDLVSYMAGKGYKPNYQGKMVLIIKGVVNAALRDGVHKSVAFRKYSAPSEEVDTVYLTVEELTDMHQLELSGTLAHIKDRFLIGAFTGLRFSDNQKITIESIRDGLIFDKNKKTGANVVIPIHKIVNEIMAKYEGGLPPVVSECYSNVRIKDISKQAGIKPEAKCKLISSHTARRSFATNAFLAGIPTLSIMYITGHKTESAFRKYIRATSEQNARTIAGHEFWSK